MIPAFPKTQMSQISDCLMEQAWGEFCWYPPSGQLGNCLVTSGAIFTFYMIFLGGREQQGPDSLGNFLVAWHYGNLPTLLGEVFCP